jgi:lipopolysaccharide assembly outer membrane protein LptD (OstA)
MPEKKEIFKKIGINVSEDNINIDLGKTKDFFNSLQNTLQEKAEAIEDDLSEGKIDLEDNMGIKVDGEHIDIDLKKAKSFIEEFGKKIEHFLGEIDHVASKLNKK